MFFHRETVGHYPPIYYERLRASKRGWVKWFAIFTPVTVLASLALVRDWNLPIAPFAPLLGAIWIYSAVSAPFSLRDDAVACVLAYFPKQSPRVHADTFGRGAALARNFQILELWAHEHNLLPLSTFGWNDDLGNRHPVWHDAAQGVETVSALLGHPDLSDELREDLIHLEAALRRAQEVGTPFCLLLRHGNGASGAEMDARTGTFW